MIGETTSCATTRGHANEEKQIENEKEEKKREYVMILLQNVIFKVLEPKSTDQAIAYYSSFDTKEEKNW